ncbi:hypothetical protein [Streptomyces luteocolor]|uniref:hypothetical protein n=1 Tax=Streptomyces luteocolor TaxID=285500 RepID=UPI000852CB5C|nr:hypothetical protein [Streptomyces luteocolor]
MPDLRDEITAMGTAYDALAPLPADQRAATLAAVRQELDTRDIEAAISEAQALGLIENAT